MTVLVAVTNLRSIPNQTTSKEDIKGSFQPNSSNSYQAKNFKILKIFHYLIGLLILAIAIVIASSIAQVAQILWPF